MMDAYDLEDYFQMLKHCGVPKAYRLWTTGPSAPITDPRIPLTRDEHNCNLGSLIDKHADAKVVDWLLVSGPVGRGKTTWVTAAFNDWAHKRLRRYKEGGPGHRNPPVWVSEAAMFANADRSSVKNYTGRSTYMHQLVGAPLLVVDDLAGSRKSPTEWQAGAIRHLVAERHANLRPTFMTTNLKTWDELEKHYGDHIVSRMIERTRGIITLGGPDRRLRSGATNE
mgnify:CR=1 FL=1|tara:strand:- start:829 stop:1503 length:675 start_codon:yes stop_codon:yes gene_type:complete